MWPATFSISSSFFPLCREHIELDCPIPAGKRGVGKNQIRRQQKKLLTPSYLFPLRRLLKMHKSQTNGSFIVVPVLYDECVIFLCMQQDGTYKLLMYSHIQMTWHKQIFFHIYLLYAIHAYVHNKSYTQGKRSLTGKKSF